MNSPDNKTSVKKSAPKKSAVRKSSTGKKVSVKKVVKKTQQGNSTRTKDTADESSVVVKQSEKANNILLAPVLVINDVRKLRLDLEKVIATNEHVYVDASSVEMIDTAMFQLLLSFTNKMASMKKNLSWSGVSAEFMNRAEALNISENLGLGRVTDE